MGWLPNSLLKGPLEMAHANPGKSGKMMKGNSVAQMLVDKFDDIFETASRQPAGATEWRSRYRGKRMDDMMGKELACAFSVDLSVLGKSAPLPPQAGSQGHQSSHPG